jgi:hypothetical protein
MPLSVKNGPPTFQRLVSKTFKENLDQFMKIFLDDFMVYSDMEYEFIVIYKLGRTHVVTNVLSRLPNS